MIKIRLLKYHPDAIPVLANIWHEVLGKVWLPDVKVESVIENFKLHLNDEALPMTFVAFDGDIPVGMCSLRENDGVVSDLAPWLGSLVVDTKYQKRGIAKSLMDATIAKAKVFGFDKIYLLAFDLTIPGYYARFGWKKIGVDEYKSIPVTVMELGLRDK